MKYFVVLVISAIVATKTEIKPQKTTKITVINKRIAETTPEGKPLSDLGDTFEDYQRLCDNFNK